MELSHAREMITFSLLVASGTCQHIKSDVDVVQYSGEKAN